MSPSPSGLDLAQHLHRAGDWPKTEHHCRQIVQNQPGQPLAWRLLASACYAQGKWSEAITGWRRVIELEPSAADAYTNLGMALDAQGKRDEAIATYQRAVQVFPDNAEAHTKLGVALAEGGRPEEGIAHLRQAIRCRPDYAPAHHNLGVALARQGRDAEAAPCLEEALRLKPDYAEACYNLGIVLVTLERRDEAILRYQQALQLKPDYTDVYNNLGLALVAAGRLGEARAMLEQLTRLRPQSPEAYNNLGLALAESGRYAEAETVYRTALRLDPRYVEAHMNLASTIKEQARPDEALAGYQLALWFQPDHSSAHWNRSLVWLQEGNFEQGWPEYEWRWKKPKAKPRAFQQPWWDGSSLAGRTILVWMEQGLGDMIHFIRYVRLLKERGARVIVECPGYLLALFQGVKGIDQLVPEGLPLPAFDVHAPLLSLPHRFGTTLATIPGEVPYLFADERRVESWRQRLARFSEFKVGVVWRGNPHHPLDRHRSTAPAQLARLAAVPGVRLISLQKDAKQIPAGVTQLEGDWDGPREAFLDTAAIIRNLDLVVTVDTALAHLAGALGVPVWVALSTVSDWRWLRHREDTPWYPSMRMFRQQNTGEWAPVFERMADALRRSVAGDNQAGTVPLPLAAGEVADKLTILEIKSVRIVDPAKLAHVRAELDLVRQARARLAASVELDRLIADLKAVNEKLWDVEDELRRCEQAGEFGSRFVELARSVYQTNDARAHLKRQINDAAGARICEVKSYGQ